MTHEVSILAHNNFNKESNNRADVPITSKDLGRYWSCILIYIGTTPPPGELLAMAQSPSVGYRWIRLDPQGPKTYEGRKISGPDERGRRRQVPGGPGPGHPQESIFWENV